MVSATFGLVVAPTTSAGAAARHDDMVYAFGSASFRGSTQRLPLERPIVGMARTASGRGYWLVASDGGVFSFGAKYYGSLGGRPLPHPVVGMTATPTGRGYWLVTSGGAVYPFGDAKQYGGMSGRPLHASIKSLVAGPGGKGYWLYASDGGVFTFGRAKFHGSTGNMRLNAPVVSMASAPGGKGYWLVASDGGVFTFGRAKFHGSTGNMRLNAPVIGMARNRSGKGYWLAATDGGVFTFGNAKFKGSAFGQLKPGRRVVQLTGMPDGAGYRMLALEDQPDVAQMGPGASGPAVSALQLRLVALGYWLPGINGVFDDLTQQAVYAFQKWHGLPRTGRVDGPTQLTFRVAQRPVPRSTAGYVIEIDKPRQVMLVNANGYARWIFNISSGSDIPYSEPGGSGNAHTPTGLFTLIRQVNGPDHGPLGTLYRPKYFTWQGHAIHGYTSVPPYPASHGCVRVSNTAMNWLWDSNTLPLGTAVWVY
jgi:lipoprotein-anchoring transpeptidase ErfK/SrfK